MEFVHFLIVFCTGVVASSFGTLIGGGAFIVIPVLIFLGLPPHMAIGTNKIGAMGLFIGGWYAFNKQGVINYRLALAMIIPAVLGSYLGARLVFQIDETLLKQVIVVLTIAILLFIFFKSDVGIINVKLKITSREYLLGSALFFLIYLYFGFYGAGAGTFLIYVLILLFGQTFIESAATTKIASLAGMIISVAVFALNRAIDYSLGAVLFTGCLIGSYLGARFSDKIGNIWIKRFFFVLVLVM